MVTKNRRLIPVEPETVVVQHHGFPSSKGAENPNNPQQLLFMFEYNSGHRTHFDYCPAQSDSDIPHAPKPHVDQNLFNRRTATVDLAYRELGLLTDAEPEVIKAAYRALSLTYHPDHTQDSSDERIKRINAAYHLIMENL